MGDELFELVRNKLIKADKCMSAADLLKNSGGRTSKAHPTSSTSTENQGASRASRRASQDMPVSL
jgi:hypothetical protein